MENELASGLSWIRGCLPGYDIQGLGFKVRVYGLGCFVMTKRNALEGLGGNSELEFRDYSPPLVDRIWLWVCSNKIPIYPIFYLLKGDYRA